MKRDGFASVTLDYVRFFAALAVVLGHGVSRFFGPFREVANPTIEEKFFRVLFSGYGSPAVMVFFVLSGLFIGQSVINQVRKDNFELGNYLARRLIRLWLVLMPALILTYFIDWYGLTYLHTDGIYQDGRVFGSVNPNNLSLSIFISNLFFLQTIVAPPLGSNGALWSLSNEFWYYVVFPLLFLPLAVKSSLTKRVLQITIASFLLYVVGFKISFLFVIWLFGVGLLYFPSNILNYQNHKKFLILGFLIFIATLLFIRLSGQLDSKLLEKVVCGVSFSIFCFTLICSDKFLSVSHRQRKVSNELAGFSYTLYLIHTPLLCLGRGIWVKSGGYLEFNAENVLLFSFIVLVILIASYGIAKVTEFHTQKVYKRLNI